MVEKLYILIIEYHLQIAQCASSWDLISVIDRMYSVHMYSYDFSCHLWSVTFLLFKQITLYIYSMSDQCVQNSVLHIVVCIRCISHVEKTAISPGVEGMVYCGSRL